MWLSRETSTAQTGALCLPRAASAWALWPVECLVEMWPGTLEPGTAEEQVPGSHVANSCLLTALGTFRDKIKKEHAWAPGKQGLSYQSEV